MERQILNPATEGEWLELRKLDVTSTMSAALFDLSPYLTRFELYHAKRDGLELPFNENERMAQGSRLQDYAADEIARKHGWTVWRADEYIRIPQLRMGSSFDYRVLCPKRGPGILEIKGVDHFRHKELWVEEQAPEHIEIQLQQQLEVREDYEWGMIAGFTSIYDWHEYERPRDREFGAAIVKKVREFWTDVDAGRAPDPDFSRDDAVIKALHKGGDILDRTEDLDFNALLARHHRLQAEKKQAEDDFKATQAELIHRLGNHSEAFGRDFKIKVLMVKDSPGTLVEESMVGTYLGARKGYPRCTVSDLHKKRGEA
ncbi:YqaJ viral recombinase family protein [Rhodopila sp.]|uniref:YqaJ viral recombinase family nuclease n=1 Tax=Rhodopila sp. TaxID=2480087 RepID=UPI003D12D3AE